jgi:hypothetical protein
MADGTTRDRRRIWSVILGAAVGAALGILVSATTDVPFAPEAGLLLGALVGWFSAPGLRRQSGDPRSSATRRGASPRAGRLTAGTAAFWRRSSPARLGLDASL